MAENSGKKARWQTLSHAGVAFPPAYSPKGFSAKFRGKSFQLSPAQEEMLWAIARKQETPYLADPAFTENFMSDFRKTLPAEYSRLKFSEIDMPEIAKAASDERAAKEAMTKEEKALLAKARKDARDKLQAVYGFAEVDGKRVERSGYVVEPAGLFMGRGAHPMRGRWKPQAEQQEIILNLGESAQIPPGKWKATVNDHTSTWLASWMDRLSERMKYMWLSDLSEIRQQNDLKKYEKAGALAKRIDKVRAAISKGLLSRKEQMRKLAIVAYLIDRLAMRVGDEKDKDEADTVGASTLRAEHISLAEGKILFDFLGKDSVRWQKDIAVASPEDEAAYSYFRDALASKRPGDLLFDGITSSRVNDFLAAISPGLSAKVFRTYHATRTVEDFLGKAKVPSSAPDYEKIYWGRLANLEAAKVCNHKRTPPKGWEDSLRKKEEKLAGLRKADAKEERLGRARREIELAVAVRDYNLNTSLRNYIDPRVYARWAKLVGADPKKIYPKSLQKKFSWLPELKPKKQ